MLCEWRKCLRQAYGNENPELNKGQAVFVIAKLGQQADGGRLENW